MTMLHVILEVLLEGDPGVALVSVNNGRPRKLSVGKYLIWKAATHLYPTL
jgi:hypothetical protein